MVRIVLVEPEIPQNTGNISRTCAVTGSSLYLVRPLGFEINDRTLKRAGLDYWDRLDLHYADSFEEIESAHPDVPFYFFTSHAPRSYADVRYPDDCFLIFGKETKGLPKSLIEAHADRTVRIPMLGGARCLNLSNAAAIATYEVLRQNGFRGFV